MTPEQRIADLELRLDKYHAWLKESIEQRDRLALDAAWGVHYGLYSVLGTVGAIFAVHYFLGDSGWLVGGLTVAALAVIPAATHVWSNGQRMKEVDTLAEIPEWEWRG